MLKLSQKNRPLAVETPLGKDVLVLQSFSGEERVNDLFSFDLQMLSEKGDLTGKRKDIVGKPIGFFVNHEDGEPRYFHGMISRFTYLGGGDRSHMYRAKVVPWLWFLTKSSDCCVYQEMSANDIVDSIFSDLGFSDFKWDLQGSLPTRKYCLQYHESDFDFVTRLLAEEGVYFYFKHEQSKHELILTNKKTNGYTPDQAISLNLGSDKRQPDSSDELTSWHHSYSFVSGKYIHTDYDFENPSTKLEVEAKTITAGGDLPGTKPYELYCHPGSYLVTGDGDLLAKNRMDAVEQGYDIITGSSFDRSLSPGASFDAPDHYNPHEKGLNSTSLIIAVQHRADGGSFVTGGSHSGKVYSNTFQAIPDQYIPRPPCTRAKPRISGIQSAVVVGPAGEEIHTDEYGRIKIQFHWDRNGKTDETASMWVRVSTPWAGSGWGMIHIPRIGQEVIIDFLDGDLDRPIVVGSLYNAEQMPPYGLPDNKTQSGIKTHSTLEGGDDNFNEIRFEDKKDKEEVYIHAEKDFNCVIENNETRKVGFDDADKGDQEIEIYNDQKLTIGEGSAGGSQTVEIYKDRDVTLETGNDKLLLKAGNMSVELQMGNQETEIAKGNQDTKIGMGNQTTKLDLGKCSTEAMQSIELKVGGNSIKIDQTGVTIKGILVKIEGDAMAEIKSPMTTVKGDGMLTLKGGLTMIN